MNSLIEGIKRLEYRGYDSAGMAWLDGPRLRVGPTLVPRASALAGVPDEENGVVIHAADGEMTRLEKEMDERAAAARRRDPPRGFADR